MRAAVQGWFSDLRAVRSSIYASRTSFKFVDGDSHDALDAWLHDEGRGVSRAERLQFDASEEGMRAGAVHLAAACTSVKPGKRIDAESYTAADTHSSSGASRRANHPSARISETARNSAC